MSTPIRFTDPDHDPVSRPPLIFFRHPSPMSPRYSFEQTFTRAFLASARPSKSIALVPAYCGSMRKYSRYPLPLERNRWGPLHDNSKRKLGQLRLQDPAKTCKETQD
ncbi:hypothetical protein LIA77_07082 [Sarocladium implicatum]|nr:hypothetical protein LIA77_07082 [Sarocladium implicatum]